MDAPVARLMLMMLGTLYLMTDAHDARLDRRLLPQLMLTVLSLVLELGDFVLYQLEVSGSSQIAVSGSSGPSQASQGLQYLCPGRLWPCCPGSELQSTRAPLIRKNQGSSVGFWCLKGQET